MKLLLDQGLPRSAVKLLELAGFDATHVGDEGHATSSDSTILQLAVSQGRVLVALDADFHRLLVVSGAEAPSVVRIRVEGLRAEALSSLLEETLPRFEDELLAGSMLTIRSANVGVRRLPLLP